MESASTAPPSQMSPRPRVSPLRHLKTLTVALALLALATPALAYTPAEIDAAAVLAEDVGLVAVLADDLYDGRDNNTPASLAVQSLLIAELSPIANGLDSGQLGDAAYKQAFATNAIGTNILAVIPGSDLASEYVMIGGHYDHLGSGVGGIFNGATDNAAGASAVIAIAKAIAALPTPPRRSIILALWDAEEDGLEGSAAFVASPLVPLSSIVAYINFDILGANLLPSLRNVSFAIGAESGGSVLQTMTANAVAAEAIGTVFLSRLFGQERSDHANFIDTIPSVFFSDATGPCYHTTEDDIDVVDVDKLKSQSRAAFRLTVELAETSSPPALVPTGALAVTYDDAVVMLSILDGTLVDLLLFDVAERSLLLSHHDTLFSIVAAGPGAFDQAAIVATIQAALDALDALATLECDGFLAVEDVPLSSSPVVLAPVLLLIGVLSLALSGGPWPVKSHP